MVTRAAVALQLFSGFDPASGQRIEVKDPGFADYKWKEHWYLTGESPPPPRMTAPPPRHPAVVHLVLGSPVLVYLRRPAASRRRDSHLMAPPCASI